MPQIPRDPALDGTLAILKDGYEFIWKRCQRMQTDVFATRVMGMKAVCIHGREAARLFYDTDKLQRHTALPHRVVTSLFGKGAIHTLDDAEHRHRKTAFLSLMSPANLERLMDGVAEQWRLAITRWETQRAVVLFDEVQRVLTAGVCAWAGVPLSVQDLPARARDLAAMVDAFGGVGPRLWKGKLARTRSEHWIEQLVEQARRGQLQLAPDCALYVMAQHRDLSGQLLPARVAAVELLNVIRPTVAVSWYIAFAALALHQHPEARQRMQDEPLEAGASEYMDLFMQEVRRYYPFTPYLGAKAREDFAFRGYHIARGTLVLLDVYGTDHDPQLWDAPDAFRPERFLRWNGDAFDFIPQGGGSRDSGHRCPGEWITMHNVTLALYFLTRCMTYEVPADQDLSIDLSRMPTRPRSGLVLRAVHATQALQARAPRAPSRTAANDSAAATGERSAAVAHAAR